MDDYVSGEGLSDDETHLALMVSTDLICFEEAVKSKNWNWIWIMKSNPLKKKRT